MNIGEATVGGRPTGRGADNVRHDKDGHENEEAICATWKCRQWRREGFWRQGAYSILAPYFSFIPSLPLEEGPLNPARVSGDRCNFPQCGLRQSPSRQRFWCILTIETLLMISKMCIVLRTWFVLPCPSLPQHSSQNFCVFCVTKNYRTFFRRLPSAGARGICLPAPYPPLLNAGRDNICSMKMLLHEKFVHKKHETR